MVADGYARVYAPSGRAPPPSGRLAVLERAAREDRRGLSRACAGPRRTPPPAPATASPRDCPAGRPIKGNLPSGIYHRPGDRDYAATRPERCFESPAEAEREGFRPTRR